jgi:hypothetical protein
VLLDDKRKEQERVVVPALEGSILAADGKDAGYVEDGSRVVLEEWKSGTRDNGSR